MEHATDYSTYLHIDDLLRLQQPMTEGAHDEMLFIVVHQVYELWFRLILHELEQAAGELQAGRPQGAVAPLRRSVQVEQLLEMQLRLLETMSPDGFMEFRDPLAPASGFQSTQYREIERLSTEVLWPALCTCIAAERINVDIDDSEQLLSVLAAIYRDHRDQPRALLHQVCELLLDHDEQLARWRHSHALMAAREIGSRKGTGGSLGVAYLETTLGKRFYPLLWEVRNRL